MKGDRRFRITGPAIVNFSGGRTSAYMLWRILEAWDGKLPADVHVVFCNTGREMPATLDFVQECGARWGVRVVWLEYRRDAETGRIWSKVVSHNSASHNGEPFEAMLQAKGMLLPGAGLRFCTTELKIRTLKRWIVAELGWEHWHNFVGLRADEMHRVMRIAKGNAENRQRWVSKAPLAKARITKRDHVMPFWAAQPFDLGLAGDWEGNCDGCFLKRIGAIKRMTADHPERMAWWAEQERLSLERGYTHGRFRIDRAGYAEIAADMQRQPSFMSTLLADDTGWDVLADCDGGCGT